MTERRSNFLPARTNLHKPGADAFQSAMESAWGKDLPATEATIAFADDIEAMEGFNGTGRRAGLNLRNFRDA